LTGVQQQHDGTTPLVGTAARIPGTAAVAVTESVWDMLWGTVGLGVNTGSTFVRESAAAVTLNGGAFVRAGNDYEVVKGGKAVVGWSE
jgi:hypothetical protein